MQLTSIGTFKGFAPALLRVLDKKKVTDQQFNSIVKGFESRLNDDADCNLKCTIPI